MRADELVRCVTYLPPLRWGCNLLCDLTSSRDLVLAFDGYVDSVFPGYPPSGHVVPGYHPSGHVFHGYPPSGHVDSTVLAEVASPAPLGTTPCAPAPLVTTPSRNDPLVTTPLPLGVPAMGIPAKVRVRIRVRVRVRVRARAYLPRRSSLPAAHY